MSRNLADPPPGLEPEGFLRRWSRRKTQADTPDAPAAAASPGPAAAPEAEPPPPGDEDMVPIESLTEDSDYAPFLSPRVSAELQRLALRKLFGQPAFNLRDGLDDYDEDFTAFAPLGDVITADLRHRLELEAERRAAAALEPSAEPGGTDQPRLAGGGDPPADADTDAPAQPAIHADPPDASQTDEDPHA